MQNRRHAGENVIRFESLQLPLVDLMIHRFILMSARAAMQTGAAYVLSSMQDMFIVRREYMYIRCVVVSEFKLGFLSRVCADRQGSGCRQTLLTWTCVACVV